MDRVSRLIAGLLLLLASFGVSAQSQYWSESPGGSGRTSGSGLELCKALYGANREITGYELNGGNYSCVYKSGSNYYLVGTIYLNTCSAPKVFINGSCQVKPSCGAGQIYQASTNTCIADCPSNGTQLPGAGPGTVFEAGNGLTTVVCLAGCEASAFMAAQQAGKNYVWGPISATGRACAAASPTPPGVTARDPACPVGKCPGTVNGQSVCVPCDKVKQTETSTKSESAATTASGAASAGPTATSTETGSSTTECANGKCTTTTTTTTTTGANGDKTDKTETTTEPQSDFCTRNPRDAVCKGTESSWGGTCAAFTCDGDAIQCAQAKAGWELACGLKVDESNPLIGVGQQATVGGDRPSDHPAHQSNTVALDLSTRLSSVPLFGVTGDCIGDKPFTFMGKGYTLPFSKWCPYLNILGSAFLAACYLSAAFIVFRD